MLERRGPPGGRVTTVAGHSLGAMSIAAWAEHHDAAARAGAAALLNTGLGDLIAGSCGRPVPALARRSRDPSAAACSSARAPRFRRFTTPASHATMRYVAFGPERHARAGRVHGAMVVGCPPDVRASIGLAMADMELHHALARLTVPTLVMAGDRDRLTPLSHARRIAAELPHLFELIVLPGTGHMGPLERPHEVSEAIASSRPTCGHDTNVVAA